MTDIVIEKTVKLDFLGENYKESFIVFKALPVGKYKEYKKKIDAVGEDEDTKSIDLIISILEENFVSGKVFSGGELVELTKENIKQLDVETIVECFQKFAGLGDDPKV